MNPKDLNKILFILIVFFLVPEYIFAQQLTKEDSVKNRLSISDSIKVYNFNPIEGYYFYEVFNKKSALYDKLEFGSGFTSSWINKHLKEKQKPFQTSDSIKKELETTYKKFLGTWIELYTIKNTTYVAKNSDYVTNIFNLSSSYLVYPYADELEPVHIITGIEEISTSYVKFTLLNQFKKQGSVEFIHLQDRNEFIIKLTLTGIYDPPGVIYFRAIKTTEKRKYPLIIEECDCIYSELSAFIQKEDLKAVWEDAILKVNIKQ
jgi:hypothetical protein